MENVVPPQITAELTQILSNLVLGNNEIRANAEKAVNERLATTPELYLLALAQFAITADTEVMRSFSLVLLRRLLFRSASGTAVSKTPLSARLMLYDQLSHQTLPTLERLLLFSLSHESSTSVRRKSVDTVCELANQGMIRGRPWHALQAQAFSMTHSLTSERGETAPGLRETAYRVFAGCPNLVMDLQVDAVLGVFQRGLQDRESNEVRHAALLASVAYLSAADSSQLANSVSLMSPMLDMLYNLSDSLTRLPLDNSSTSNFQYLSTFLSDLTPLCTTHPILFAPHLQNLLSFFPSIILPSLDCGPTPTVSKPFPVHQSSFIPPSSTLSPHDQGDATEERSTLRLSALEFMISLTEARPNMVRKLTGWTEIIVRACLEGMGEFDEDDTLEDWLAEDPSNSNSSNTDSPPSLYEQAIDRLACSMGGRTVLPPAFQHIPSMMASFDWRIRHAGLMAIAAIAEGTGKVMQKELGKIIDLVVPMIKDPNPRVRYAACQCVGQLCTDLEEVIQKKYHQQLFSVLIPALEDAEPRVHAHAAAALINFCEGVERDTLIPYLDTLVDRLLKLLNPNADQLTSRRYVQEQAITTLAMLADASETTFTKHYSTIMPLLLSVLQNANGPDFQKLRVKAMECAGLIAVAVGPDVFRQDSKTLIELLMRIQSSLDPNDTQLSHYLMATWAKVCQAMRQEFEPYLPIVMPSLLTAASAKADLSRYDDDESGDEREGWETIMMDGETFGIKTSSMEEKCQAFETLVIYCSTLGPRFAPYLSQTLEISLPCIKFYFHEGVREACAMLIPLLLSCGKHSGTLTTQMATVTFLQLINNISTESDATFLASLYKYFAEAVRVIGGPEALSPQLVEGIMDATKRQLGSLADRRKSRATNAQVANPIEVDRDDLSLVEEIEDYALDDMAKTLVMFDPNHPLLVAVSSVRDLGFNSYDSDEDADEGYLM